MSLSKRLFCFGLVLITLFLILVFSLPEARAEAKVTDFFSGTVSISSSNSSSLNVNIGYHYIIFAVNDDLKKAFEIIQQQESNKISQEIERIRLEEEKREKEQQAKLKLEKSRSVRLQIIQVPNQIVGDFEGSIRTACSQYGCDPEQLIRVMYCESGGRSNAVNGIHSGIFQFNPNTFKSNAKRVGLVDADIWNPYHQITVAAWMFANGQAWQWQCK